VATLTIASAAPATGRSAGLSYWRRAARHLRADAVTIFALVLLVVVALLGLAAPLIGRVLGSTNLRLMVQHVMPNVVSIVLVVAGFDVAAAILAESGLGALGLGVQPPTASWGNMLAKSFQYALKAPWLVVAPGVMIFLTVFSVFLTADGLRDALDPRLA
jgi:peptide/nickel transport system permease protein